MLSVRDRGTGIFGDPLVFLKYIMNVYKAMRISNQQIISALHKIKLAAKSVYDVPHTQSAAMFERTSNE